MAIRTEQERLESVSEEAAREVDGYIERIEKQAEQQNKNGGGLTPAPGATASPPLVYDDLGKIVMQSSQLSKPKIVLPLDENGVRRGLTAPLIDAFRWVAEWCVYVIRKYPGRVFYREKQLT